MTPSAWRRFLIPENVTLHLVLQDIMGWENYHLYLFKVDNKEYAEPDPDNEFYQLDFKNSKCTKFGYVIKEKHGIGGYAVKVDHLPQIRIQMQDNIYY